MMLKPNGKPRTLLALLLLAGTGTAFAADRIAPEGELGRYWTVADGHSLSVAGYPETMLDAAPDACVAIAYRVGADGRTSLPTVINAWDSVNGDKLRRDKAWDAFALSAEAAVATWRFQPLAGVEPEATVTVSTFGFVAADTASGPAIRNHCRISDAALAKAGRQMSHRLAMDRSAHGLMGPRDQMSAVRTAARSYENHAPARGSR